ncbi:hypothetical protein [Cellulomonas fimi]|uniref:Uncharacterized protein n=1 Tax=Cellulomonas fimi (strain ATCC 484 / DSM 20113 / JCM 1341 / CCUG 24087 / LMG 16345 / NBRC 15513 / NCIMB 8980 / NCTC 7547 / NRS-133) TaxID=590998 RepID=F4H4R6_CELFA|nr:hypothetical protein [Cellulomonas fimi]AEE44267.1 hypothetical protein Celf_0117 [Cellulomonas fimi ATCC 484]NNH05714.1 hypothetical protein [Cellulomonas fimi]VEH26002.1 Uncharacterised protein [Cellulomonas fimi]
MSECEYYGTCSSAPPTAVLVVMVVLYAAAIALGIWVYKRILNKAGYSAWWMLLIVVPVGNLIGLVLFAAKEWPVEAELRRVRGQLLMAHAGGGGAADRGVGRTFGAPDPRFSAPDPRFSAPDPRFSAPASPDPRFAGPASPDLRFGAPDPRFSYGAAPDPFSAPPDLPATPPPGLPPYEPPVPPQR